MTIDANLIIGLQIGLVAGIVLGIIILFSLGVVLIMRNKKE